MTVMKLCSAVLLGAALAGAAAPALACGTSNVVLDDKFEKLDPSWGNKSDNLFLADGKLAIKPDANAGYHAFNQSNIYADADICVTAELGDGAGHYGLVVWGADDNNYYMFYAHPDGYFGLYRKVNGRWLTPYPSTNNAAIKKGAGQWNELEIRTKGNHLVLLINGTQVAEANGTPPQGGGMAGVYGESDSQTARATLYYQEFKITQ
jgi:hypothetical protein